jgi:hypothetical protein
MHCNATLCVYGAYRRRQDALQRTLFLLLQLHSQRCNQAWLHHWQASKPGVPADSASSSCHHTMKHGPREPPTYHLKLQSCSDAWMAVEGHHNVAASLRAPGGNM